MGESGAIGRGGGWSVVIENPKRGAALPGGGGGRGGREGICTPPSLKQGKSPKSVQFANLVVIFCEVF